MKNILSYTGELAAGWSDCLLDVVAREEAGNAAHNSLPPTVVILLQHVDYLPLLHKQIALAQHFLVTSE